MPPLCSFSRTVSTTPCLLVIVVVLVGAARQSIQLSDRLTDRRTIPAPASSRRNRHGGLLYAAACCWPVSAASSAVIDNILLKLKLNAKISVKLLVGYNFTKVVYCTALFAPHPRDGWRSCIGNLYVTENTVAGIDRPIYIMSASLDS